MAIWRREEGKKNLEDERREGSKRTKSQSSWAKRWDAPTKMGGQSLLSREEKKIHARRDERVRRWEIRSDRLPLRWQSKHGGPPFTAPPSALARRNRTESGGGEHHLQSALEVDRRVCKNAVSPVPTDTHYVNRGKEGPNEE